MSNIKSTQVEKVSSMAWAVGSKAAKAFLLLLFFFQHRNSDFISWRDLHVTVSILQQNLPRDPGWRDFANDSQPSGSPAKVKIPVAQVSPLTLSSQKELR